MFQYFRLLKAYQLFLVTLFSVFLFSQNTYAEPLKTCAQAATAAILECKSSAATAIAAESAASAAASASMAGNNAILDGSEVLTNTANETGTQKAAARTACLTQKTTCVSTCNTALSEAPAFYQEPNVVNTKTTMIKEEIARCEKEIGVVSAKLGFGAVGAFVAANKAALVTGAVAAAAGYMLGKSNGSKGGSGGGGSGGSNGTNGTGGGDGTGTVDCADSANSSDANCYSTYLPACQADMNADGCTAFFSSYCATGSDGAGSGLCAQTQSVAYCQDGTQSDSPACQWTSSMSSTCTQSLGSPECLPQYGNRAEVEAACAGKDGDPLCNAILNEGLEISGTTSNLPSALAGGSVSTGSGTTGTLTAASTGRSGSASRVTLDSNGSANYNGRQGGSYGSYRGGSYRSGSRYQRQGTSSGLNLTGRSTASTRLPADVQSQGGGSTALFNSHHQHFLNSCAQNSYVGCHSTSSLSYGGTQ